MDLETKLAHLVGIGPNLARRLELLGLVTVWDLINHYPFRYDDYSKITTTLDAKVGEKVTLVGEIWSIANVYTRFRKVLTRAIFNDGNSSLELIWFNSSWLTKSIKSGDKLQISGKLTKKGSKYSILMPIWEKMTLDESSSSLTGGSIDSRRSLPRTAIRGGNDKTLLHTGRLVPVYPETLGLNSKWIRQKIALILPKILSQIKDPLPETIKGNMLDLKNALNQIHFPKDYTQVNQARERLGFDELFYIQLATLKVRQSWQKKQPVQPLDINQSKLDSFISTLPFKLTGAQKRVMEEIIEDLRKTFPCNRLVQGEVGSGKTVVAAIISYLIHLNDLKTLFMAPTEILAFQHYSTLNNLLGPYGIKVGIYTGSRKFTKDVSSSKYHVLSGGTKKHEKKHNTKYIIHNTLPNVIVGTHALLSSSLSVDNVGLIIVDEQQRFGVQQRTLLRNKAKVPHFLTMTATPIPRTVALTLYGDLDLSVIDEMPKGRKLVKTFVVPNKKRKDAYGFIAKKVKEGDQVYNITPLIEESETLKSAKAAKVEFEKLKKVFPDLKLGLLHGRLKSKEKEKVITDFKDHKLDLLVSTSVVEVGMDITNATIMVIEGAERFGLAQLHQFRGRVGRGEKESFCFLFAEDERSENLSRLKALEKTFDGLKLAEIDLKIRGSGEIFGKKQSGRFDLKIASFLDLPQLEKSRNSASKIIKDDPSLDKYPLLQAQLATIAGDVNPD